MKKHMVAQFHTALADSGVSNEELKCWISEVLNKFYLDNFSVHPVLFGNKEINKEPMLGKWSWVEFCGRINQQFCDMKDASFNGYQKIKILETKVESLQAQNKAQTEAIEELQKQSRTQSDMLRSQSNMLRAMLNHLGVDHCFNDEHIVDSNSNNINTINSIVGQNDSTLNSVSIDVDDKVRTYCIFTYVHICIYVNINIC